MSDYRRKKVMKIAAMLSEIRCDVNKGKCNFSSNGWLDYYCYEPIADVLEQLLEGVIIPLRGIMRDDECDWEWRIFGQDGYLQFYSDGRKFDEEYWPIDGTCAISEYLSSIKT